MNKPTRASTHLVEILTPVHVGTGKELVNESDYILETGQLRVIDKNTLFNILVESERKDLEDLSSIKMTQLSDLVGYAGTRDGYILKPLDGKTFRNANGNLKTVQIREHIKDGFFRPYLPGSSIKGAIRTALLAEMIMEQGLGNLKKEKPPLLPTIDKPSSAERASAERASEKLSRHLFARNAPEEKQSPHFDFLRALHVGDAKFENKQLPETLLKLIEVNHFNPGSGKGLTTYTEALIQDTRGFFTLQWDDFLFENEKAKSLFEWETLPEIADFDKLREILNAHAIQRLEEEITVFKKHHTVTYGENLLETVTKDKTAGYLQLGWGGGWCSKTGNWMDRETKAEMRKLYPENLGSGENFPKTRRLVVKNGQPYFPLGWIKIYSATSVKPESYRWVEKTLQEIQSQFRYDLRSALFSKQLAEQWQRLTEDTLRKAVLEEIKQRWQSFDEGVDWWEQDSSKLPTAGKKAKKIYEHD